VNDGLRTPNEGSGTPDPFGPRVDAPAINAAIRRAAGRYEDPPKDDDEAAEPPPGVKIDAGAGGSGNYPPEDFNAAIRRTAGFPP
jgi:hypothetical protein